MALALVLLLLKDPQRGAMEEQSDTKDQSEVNLMDGDWREVVTDVVVVVKSTPALLWTMLGAIFLHIPLGAGQFAIVWLERERGFGLGEISATYGLIYIVILSDWYQANFKGGRVRFLAYLMIAITPLLILFRFVSPSSALFYIGMAAGMFSVSSFYGPAFSTVQDLTPVRLRGVMTGLLLVACNLLGLGIGALMTGVLSDVFFAYAVFEPLTKALLSADVLAVGAPVSFIIASIYLERSKIGG
jgi:hypothetical protein